MNQISLRSATVSQGLEIWKLSIFNAEDMFVKRDYLQWSKFPQKVETFLDQPGSPIFMLRAVAAAS